MQSPVPATSVQDGSPNASARGARPNDAIATPLRIAIADDHAVVRAGYRRLLELDQRMRIVAEFGDGESAYRWLSSNAADVLILDLTMPGHGGLATLQRLRQRVPALRVLIFTMHESADLAAQTLRIGAAGYITKSSAPESLVAAVREVAAGGRPVSPDVARALPDAARKDTPHDALSSREFEIFLMLARGGNVEDIAASRCLSAKTIANYQTSIRQKTGLGSSLDMYRYAVAHDSACRRRDGTEVSRVDPRRHREIRAQAEAAATFRIAHRRTHLDLAAVRPHALAHAGETVAAMRRLVGRVETDAVVFDAPFDTAARARTDANADAPGIRVARRVGQRFLRESIQHERKIVGHIALAELVAQRVIRALARSFAPALHEILEQPPQRNAARAGIAVLRPQFTQQIAHLAVEALAVPREAADDFAKFRHRCRVMREPGHVRAHRGQRLAEFIVQLACDPRAFFFLRRHQLETDDTPRLARARQRRGEMIQGARDAIHFDERQRRQPIREIVALIPFDRVLDRLQRRERAAQCPIDREQQRDAVTG